MAKRPSTLEGMGVMTEFWRGKSVFVTGHTGFKGGWLVLWLTHLGAKVHGYALEPSTSPSFFRVAKIEQYLQSHVIGDVRDAAKLQRAMQEAEPEFVFHLAAQPLVRVSYQQPVDTYSTNVMGTVYLLEAVRSCQSVRSVVNVTTDKCYDNKEWDWGYRETDHLGGFDPYSSSKGCAEIVTAAYRASYLAQAGVAVATARAGNVFGGGDWSADRLIPDFFRANDSGQSLAVRFPHAIRPWQHVLEPVSAYMLLAEQLHLQGQKMAQAWNFGPNEADAITVGNLLDSIARLMPGTAWHTQGEQNPHEAKFLKLDSSKSRNQLNWRTRWNLNEALGHAVNWHRAWRAGEDMTHFSLQQVRIFEDICEK